MTDEEVYKIMEGMDEVRRGDVSGKSQTSGSVEDQIEAVCEFVKAYEKRKFEIMHKGGKMLGVVFFMKDYCESLRMKPNKEITCRSKT